MGFKYCALGESELRRLVQTAVTIGGKPIHTDARELDIPRVSVNGGIIEENLYSSRGNNPCTPIS